MSSNMSAIRQTIIPKSDQLNADQLFGVSVTIKVTRVEVNLRVDQPVIIHYEGEDGRPYKPCKTMRRVLVFGWGEDVANWAGRSLTLYNQHDVKFGGQEVGGVRISHMSHIDEDICVKMTATRGKKEPITIKRLRISTTDSMRLLSEAASLGMIALRKAWESIGDDQRMKIDPSGCPSKYKDIAQKVDDDAVKNDSVAP